MRGIRTAVAAAAASVTAVALVSALPLGAHVERDPFFVDPAPDTSIIPAAGGGFVEARSLDDPVLRLDGFKTWASENWTRIDEDEAVERFSRLSAEQQDAALDHLTALQAEQGGPTPESLGLTDPRLTAEETLVVCQGEGGATSLARLEESLAQVEYPATRENRIRELNQSFAELCAFDEIQEAVTAADNGDTIVIMPGFYTEPTSRSAPHNDPRCADMVEQGERNAPSPTYEYHVTCPNDMSLVTVAGRAVEGGLDAECLRCNLQIHGSGARPEDVLLEGAADPADPGVTGDLFEEGKGHVPAAKEVGMRFERTDGAYVGNLTVRNVSEHGFYSIEADGMTFEDVNSYYGHEYGHLSFVTDHLTVAGGDFAGSGDAGIYPGASPPSAPRLSSRIIDNRSHHNAIGLSGSMGSALLIEGNEFDNNSTGITLDSISRTGHPGYPQRGTVIRENRIHSNNFDTYGDDAWVRSTVQAPIGAGIVFGGGNDNWVAENWIYDNWRWGTALISVPDPVTRPLPDGLQIPEDLKYSTSHRNKYTENKMGITPTGELDPNGTDFWWDEMGEQNCWQGNTGSGPGGAISSDPPAPLLPTRCDTFPNVGTGNPVKMAILVDCNFVAERDGSDPVCDWFKTPEEPTE